MIINYDLSRQATAEPAAALAQRLPQPRLRPRAQGDGPHERRPEGLRAPARQLRGHPAGRAAARRRRPQVLRRRVQEHRGDPDAGGRQQGAHREHPAHDRAGVLLEEPGRHRRGAHLRLLPALLGPAGGQRARRHHALVHLRQEQGPQTLRAADRQAPEPGGALRGHQGQGRGVPAHGRVAVDGRPLLRQDPAHRLPRGAQARQVLQGGVRQAAEGDRGLHPRVHCEGLRGHRGPAHPDGERIQGSRQLIIKNNYFVHNKL